MANKYKVWKPGVSISDDTELFDAKLEEEYQNGYKINCSFRDVIIFEKFSQPSKVNIMVTEKGEGINGSHIEDKKAAK